MTRVVCEHVSKVFRGRGKEPVYAVKDLSLAVEPGEFLVLVGPSGSGKTTTLRLVAGLEEPTSGTISLDGRVVNQVDPGDRDVAMVFQNCPLHPHLTVHENMALGLRLRGGRRTDVDQRVRAVAETLGLGPLLDRLPAALSGGQRQRAAVGRALVREPRVFLFDEPLSDLDAALRRQLRQEFKRLQARLGTTTLYVTHDQAEAMALGRRLAVLRDGVLQQVDEPLQVYAHPANLFVAGFIGSPPMNVVRGSVVSEPRGPAFKPGGVGGRPDQAVWALPAAHHSRLEACAGREIVLGLRPEAILPGAPAPGRSDGLAADLAVDFVEPLGADAFVHGVIGDAPLVVRWPSGHLPSPGQSVPVWLDLAQARYFDAASEQAIRAGRPGAG